MSNLTVAIDDALLAAAREYARAHGTSVNALVRRLLEQAVRPPERSWFDELEELARAGGGDSRGRRWTRDELYERKDPAAR